MTKTFIVQNLKCGGCENTIKNGIMKLDKVTMVDVVVEKSEVIVSMESDSSEMISQKLSQMGYPLSDESNSIIQKATSYVSCAIGKISQD